MKVTSNRVCLTFPSLKLLSLPRFPVKLYLAELFSFRTAAFFANLFSFLLLFPRGRLAVSLLLRIFPFFKW